MISDRRILNLIYLLYLQHSKSSNSDCASIVPSLVFGSIRSRVLLVLVVWIQEIENVCILIRLNYIHATLTGQIQFYTPKSGYLKRARVHNK